MYSSEEIGKSLRTILKKQILKQGIMNYHILATTVNIVMVLKDMISNGE